MKKVISILLAMVLVFSLAACGGSSNNTTTAAGGEEPAATTAENAGGDAGETAETITLWTYPIGGWGNEETVNGLLEGFKAATGITVNVEFLDYSEGDTKVNSAIAAKQAPDLIMEGPERLVANWGANGYMVDLSDLLDDEDIAEINEAALAACYSPEGAVYEYPMVMTAHCMAINKTVFEAAGADQYYDADAHTWNSTEDFLKAVQAVYESTNQTVGVIYCAGQGGDQGTRAIVTNMYGGSFTDAEHTTYTWNSEENVKALQALYDAEGIEFDAAMVGGDEIAAFYQGTLNMAFCWNIAQQLNPNTADTGSGLTMSGDEILFLGFPTEDGSTPSLQGGIWGFGVFDNGDDAKIAAAKEFIKYMCDSEATADAVKAASYFAVRDTAEGTDLSTIWADNDVMNEYTKLMPMLGDYYQVTTNWPAARYQWWNMLQEVGAGADIAESVAAHADNATAGISE